MKALTYLDVRKINKAFNSEPSSKFMKLIKLISCIFLCQLAGIFGSLFMDSNWYESLVKPWFQPPSWLFGPVWITLYLLMGISLYLILINKKKSNLALGAFGVQLILNALWTLVFFGLNNIFLAFIEIVLLWLAILATIYLFYEIDKRAAYLLAPYIIWVTFAMILTFSIWRIN